LGVSGSSTHLCFPSSGSNHWAKELNLVQIVLDQRPCKLRLWFSVRAKRSSNRTGPANGSCALSEAHKGNGRATAKSNQSGAKRAQCKERTCGHLSCTGKQHVHAPQNEMSTLLIMVDCAKKSASTLQIVDSPGCSRHQMAQPSCHGVTPHAGLE
jgi:hypothetical protein